MYQMKWIFGTDYGSGLYFSELRCREVPLFPYLQSFQRLIEDIFPLSDVLLNKALKMEAVCSSDTLVSTYKSTRRYDPKGLHRHLCHCFQLHFVQLNVWCLGLHLPPPESPFSNNNIWVQYQTSQQLCCQREFDLSPNLLSFAGPNSVLQLTYFS
jgi:hypothetical protein